jgi:predicted membrane protein
MNRSAQLKCAAWLLAFAILILALEAHSTERYFIPFSFTLLAIYLIINPYKVNKAVKGAFVVFCMTVLFMKDNRNSHEANKSSGEVPEEDPCSYPDFHIH